MTSDETDDTGPQTHVLKAAGRTITLRIHRCPDHIHYLLGMDRYGDSSPEDEESFLRWFELCTKRYEDDPRPILVHHPTTGQVMLIGDGFRVEAQLIRIPRGD